MDSDNHGAVWRFAGRELHEASHELFVHGRLVALERKSFELLRCLIRHAGDVVTRDELVAIVWSGRVVSDSVVSRTVMKLRKALGDGDQHIITTVHGYGYRLAVPVETQPTPGLDRSREPSWRQLFRGHQQMAAAAATVIVALCAVLAWNRLGTATAPRLALLPVAVEEDAGTGWVRLGLMGYLATELGKQFDVLPESRVLARIGNTRPGAVDRLRSAYGPLDVLETSLDASNGAVRLRYTLHRSGKSPASGYINAGSPIQAADLLLERLYEAFDAGREAAAGVPLANELYARGRAAMMAGDARRARDYLQTSLREDPEMHWTRYELALALRQLGELDQARDILERIAGDPDVTPKLAAASRQSMGILHWRQGRLDRAEAMLRQALEIAERHDLEALLAGQWLTLGIVVRSRGDHGQARELYLRALHLSRARGDRDTEARVHNSLGVLAWKNGEVDRSFNEHAQALAIRRELELPRELAASLNNLATVAIARGRWRQADELLREAGTLRAELGDGAGLASTRRNQAKLAYLRGDYGEAEGLMHESLALALDHGYASAEAAAFSLGAEIAARRGDPQTALQRIEAAAERYRAIGQHADATAARLTAAALPGADAESALDLAEEVLGDADTRLHLKARARMLRASIRAAEDPRAAARDWDEAIELADRLGQLELVVHAALAYGEMLLENGRHRDAEPLLARLGQWPEYIPALRLRARYWDLLGESRRATELMQRAESLAAASP